MGFPRTMQTISTYDAKSSATNHLGKVNMSVSELISYDLKGDAAKRRITEDEFGLGEIARVISTAIQKRGATEGYGERHEVT